MNYTWGFLLIAVIVILPGIIIRRLYYFGEFSKQYGSNEPILKFITISLFPGVVNAIMAFYGYQVFFKLFPSILKELNVTELLDAYNAMFHYKNGVAEQVKPGEFIEKKAPYYLCYLYIQSIILGGLSGRIIHFLNLDKRFKVLRYNNYWYYAFSKDHLKFKKYKLHKDLVSDSNGNYLYTKADVLIDSEGGPLLYGGIIVDYNLDPQSPSKLQTLVLRSTKYYKQGLENVSNEQATHISGSIMIIDCSNMLNISLTHIYAEKMGLPVKWARPFYSIYGFLLFFVIVITIFKFGPLHWDWYANFFMLHWSERILFAFANMAFMVLVLPIDRIEPNKYEWKNKAEYRNQVIAFIILSAIAWGYSYLFF